MITLKSFIQENTVSISDKAKVAGEMAKEQDRLFAESKKIGEEMIELQKKFESDMRKLSNEQEKIAQRLAAINDTMKALLK